MFLIGEARQRSIWRVLFVHSAAMNRAVGLSWGSDCTPSWRIHCHWDRSGGGCMSSCVIVFTVRVCAWVCAPEWKIVYQFSLALHHSGSVSSSFAGVDDIYIQNYSLSQRENGSETGRERESGIVWSDLLCWCVLKLLMQSYSLFWIVLWREYCNVSEQNESSVSLRWQSPCIKFKTVLNWKAKSSQR